MSLALDYGTLQTLCAVAGLIIFGGFFVSVLVWVYLPGSASRYRKAAQIPLKD